MIKKIITNNENETIQFASEFAKTLKTGDIVLLCGELGAGKTKFTEGILSYFNLQNEISSPTFTIVNEYHNNSISIFHFDLYRLSSIDEFYEIGGDEYLSKGICLIEWGELIKEILPSHYIQINFKKLDNEKRELEIIS